MTDRGVADVDVSEADTAAKVPTVAAAALKQAASDAKDAAFGSPHPEPTPEAPAPASPVVNPAKQLDFNSNNNPLTPATPSMLGPHAEELDYNAFIVDTLLWKNKIRSSFYFVAGCLAWLVFRAILTSSVTMVTGVCNVLMASLMFNFLRGVVAPRLQEHCTWAHSGITRFVSAASTTVIAAAASLHDRHLHGLDPIHTVEIGLGLWLLSFLGRALDVATLLLLLHLGAFALPLLYKTHKSRIDAIAADAYSKANAQYQKLDRRLRAVIVLGPMLALLFLLPIFDRVVAIFIILAYGRALAKPDEYASFQKRIVPMGKSITNAVVTPLSKAATSAMTKYDITPTPTKKKTT